MAEASGKSRAADEILRVKRIFVFDRTNYNRNESQRDFRRATRPIHRHRADEWKKHPQWVLLVHSSGIEPESAAPEATVLSVILRVRNFLTYILYFIRARVSNDYGKSKREN